jgi:hypothetical protein
MPSGIPSPPRELDDGLTMLAGPARNSALLEIGVVNSADGPS